jgi:hypothetical protein
MKNLIKYYPVDNGDMSLIQLKDQTNIVVDCNIRQASVGSTDPKIFDVKKDLLNSIQRRDGNYFVDVFILTHGDCDHCRGYKTHFYQGDPKKYGEKNRKNNEIIIDEMWFSPMIAEEHTNDDEDAYQQEAERRLEMHRNKHADRDLPGNRIKIVGYDSNKNYSDLNHLRAVPGSVVSSFNNRQQMTFSTFIHAPFKEHLISAEKDKNSTSIVFQARFKENTTDRSFKGLAMFGGDSDHYSWSIILEKTKKYKNDKNEQALDWDIFLAPHHCSWSFFNDRPQEENPIATDTSLEVLSYKRTSAKVIASSKKVVDDNDNPPHFAAKKEYEKQLDSSSDFLNTAVTPTESAPEPIIFELTSNGFERKKTSGETRLAAAIGVSKSSVIQKPWCKDV